MRKIIIFCVFEVFYFEDKISFNSSGKCCKISDTVISDCTKALKKSDSFHVRPQFSQNHKETFSTLPLAILTFYTVKLWVKTTISIMFIQIRIHTHTYFFLLWLCNKQREIFIYSRLKSSKYVKMGIKFFWLQKYW